MRLFLFRLHSPQRDILWIVEVRYTFYGINRSGSLAIELLIEVLQVVGSYFLLYLLSQLHKF